MAAHSVFRQTWVQEATRNISAIPPDDSKSQNWGQQPNLKLWLQKNNQCRQSVLMAAGKNRQEIASALPEEGHGSFGKYKQAS